MRTELYIGGAWRAGAGERFASHDPATGDKVWEGRAADADDVAEAMAAARLAFPSWSRRPLEERVAIARAFAKAIEARADEIARTISREMGKPLWDAKGEVQAMIDRGLSEEEVIAAKPTRRFDDAWGSDRSPDSFAQIVYQSLQE